MTFTPNGRGQPRRVMSGQHKRYDARTRCVFIWYQDPLHCYPTLHRNWEVVEWPIVRNNLNTVMSANSCAVGKKMNFSREERVQTPVLLRIWSYFPPLVFWYATFGLSASRTRTIAASCKLRLLWCEGEIKAANGSENSLDRGLHLPTNCLQSDASELSSPVSPTFRSMKSPSNVWASGKLVNHQPPPSSIQPGWWCVLHAALVHQLHLHVNGC
jgi:hypothetical protein